MISRLFMDLDGTLTDPADGITRSLNHALVALRQPPREPESLRSFIGPPLGRVFEDLLGTSDPDRLRAAIDFYRASYDTVGILENRIYPGIPHALEALASSGVNLCLVTSKPIPFANRVLEWFDLMRYFRSVYGSPLEGLGENKVSLIQRALSAEAVKADQVMMVGDRSDDVTGAQLNQVRSIGVTWGFGSREELAAADHLIDHPRELVSLARDIRGRGTE